MLRFNEAYLKPMFSYLKKPFVKKCESSILAT